MENDVKEKTTVATLQQWFTDAEDATIDARTESERARDYVDGAQLTSDEVATLKKRGQPPVVYNRVRRKVEWLLGLEIKQRTDPKAFPRTPDHQEGAEAVTDAIRFVCDNQDWDEKRTLVYDNQLIEGFGAVEVVHEQNPKGEVEVIINHYPWDRLFYDPHSRKIDFSDARYKGVVLWMDHADFVLEYPKHKGHIDGLFADSDSTSDTHDDRPRDRWTDTKRKRVRVLLIWFREGGEWRWCKFVKGMKLDQGPSPYVDEDGKTVCPLIMTAAYVGRENDRYGIVRDMFDPQDEINKRRSKALHQSVMRQVMMTKGAADPDIVRRELAKPDGIIEVELGSDDEFQILNNSTEIQAQLALMQEAKNEIDLMGANSALEGETGESTSGRAVLARQQGGMIEIGAMNDKLHRFTRTVYRHIWMRIKQYWTEERWIRVTDEEKNIRFVGFNRPITLADHLSNIPPEEAAAMAQALALGPNDPRLQQQVGIDNEVEQMDVDIIIEEVPDQVTLQGEMFTALANYAKSGVIPPEVLIEADPTLPTKKKEQLLKIMEEKANAPTQPDPQVAIDQAELEFKAQELQFKGTELQFKQAEAQASNEIDRAKLQLEADKVGADVQIKRDTVEIARRKADSDIQSKTAQTNAAQQQVTQSADSMGQVVQAINQGNQSLSQQIQAGTDATIQAITAPRELIKDKQGRPTGSRIAKG